MLYWTATTTKISCLKMQFRVSFFSAICWRPEFNHIQGCSQDFSRGTQSIYYLRLSFTKKWFFLRPFGHCFWLTESPYVDVIILYVHLLRIQAEVKTTRSRFIQSNLLFSPFSPSFVLIYHSRFLSHQWITSVLRITTVRRLKKYIFKRKARMCAPYVWVATPLTSLTIHPARKPPT